MDARVCKCWDLGTLDIDETDSTLSASSLNPLFLVFSLQGHLMDVLKIGRDGDAGIPVRSKVAAAARGEGGEHSVKQFLNIKVRSSKEEVKVHAKNELVSEAGYCCVCVSVYMYIA